MAVFYSSKKSSVGTNTGSIIMWSSELASNDPDDPGLNNICLLYTSDAADE